VPIEKDRNYRVTFWIKGKGGEYVLVNILRLGQLEAGGGYRAGPLLRGEERLGPSKATISKGDSTTSNTRFEFALGR